MHIATPLSAQIAEWQMEEWHKEVAKNSTSDKTVIPWFQVPLNPPFGFKPSVPSTSASSLASCSRAYADGCRAGTEWESNPGPYGFVRSAVFSNFLMPLRGSLRHLRR